LTDTFYLQVACIFYTLCFLVNPINEQQITHYILQAKASIFQSISELTNYFSTFFYTRANIIVIIPPVHF